MKLSISQKPYTTHQCDMLIIPVTDLSLTETSPLSVLNKLTQNRINFCIDHSLLKDEKGSSTVLLKEGDLAATRVVICHIGSYETTTYNDIRHAMGNAIRNLPTPSVSDISILLPHTPLDASKVSQALIEGLVLGNYTYTHYKSKSDTQTLNSITLFTDEDVSNGAELGLICAEATCIARDLANSPANHLTPRLFIEKATQLFSNTDITLSVISEDDAKALGMHSFLAVGQGSTEPSFMLVMKYMPVQNEAPLALIGKGVTFDTGGVSIKPALGMSSMKADMSGAAAVVSTMVAISKIKPQKNIMAITPLTENMNSGSALKPGDVITAMNGKTIEIINTDAEGRLILADALCYAVKEGATSLIDIATLTGACSVALGKEAAGILGSDQGMIDTFTSLASFTGERVWQLPLYDEFLEYLKSDTADIANACENRLAGTSTAAKFLEQFTSNLPWVHLDIASVMAVTQTKGHLVKGMSGAGTRNLIEFILQATTK